jgi:hypothetical protein
MSITKMAYAEPRMFWVVEELIPDECIAEYGNPSGHTELSIAFPIMLYLDFFWNRNQRRITEGKMTPLQIVSLIGAVLYSFLVGFARLYVRVHSLNQIVFGWTIGLWTAIYLHFCVRDLLISHIDSIAVRPKLLDKTRNRYLIISSILFAICCSILTGTYFLSVWLSPP